MSEFNHPIGVHGIPNKGLRVRIEADEGQRQALVERFDLIALEEPIGALEVKPLASGPMARAAVRITARPVQACVVSCGPVVGEIDVDTILDFAPPDMVEENLNLMLADADSPEPIEGDTVELGEVCTQQFALALNPYPRADGMDLARALEAVPAGRHTPVETDTSQSSFAALAGLRGANRDDC